ncbi:cell division protein SepF [Virgibacillus senegalensis]|uniref:cell division protein SepF n=1 Tax=Virgibacillus senegalensis TaxID=1499679 RepID=UPI00069CC0FE|nr:cell division protein SepF [Virgibacillus senegalensis]
MSFKNKLKTFFTLDDEYEYIEEEEELEVPEAASKQKGQGPNVVSLKSVQPASKVVLLEPRTYSEAQEIADNIVNRRAVVINLQRVDHNQAKRIVDFLSGTVYAVSGDIQKLGSHTFLCTPDNVDVSGTISDMFEEDFDKRW